MDLSAEMEGEIRQVMDTYWNSYLTGDINTWASFLAEDYKNIGTTEEEVWDSKKDIVDYTHRVLHQLTGIAEVRHKISQVIPLDPYIMVHEYGDLYLKSGEGWVFYSKIRMSTLMEHANGTWKILHQHGSYPDSHTERGETFGFDKLKRENNELREAVQRRTIDLEIKNRELEVEAALERVRGRTMAMQVSSELNDVIAILYNELRKLHQSLDRCFIMTFDIDSLDAVWWMASRDDANYRTGLVVPYATFKPQLEYINAWKGQTDKWTYVLEGKEKLDWDRYLFNDTDLKVLPDIVKHNMQVNDTAFLSGSFRKFGCITTGSFEPLSEQAFALLIRFAGVFDQTYTRFIDLQKAEAQAREAQIEAALERVRSKTMAMHSSEDVGETASVLVEELRKLGIETLSCGIGIMHEPGKMEVWTIKTEKDDRSGIIIGTLDMHMHPLLHGAFENWRQKGAHFSYTLKDDDLIKYYEAINNYPDYPIRYDLLALPTLIHHNEFYFPEGVLFAFSLQSLVDAQKEIFKRFAGIFGQTYRRYLDLIKAESQAREAEIELALERVRARTMAMHSSNDVSIATATLFTELEKLGVQNLRGGITIISPDQTQEVWSVTRLSDGITLRAIGTFDMRLHPFWQQIFKAFIDKEEFDYYRLAGKDKANYITLLNTTPHYLDRPITDFPDVHVQSYFFGQGAIWTNSLEPHGEADKQIMKKFVSVFSLTFRRYQDLQKAEEQARESQIQLALERVRARTMAMQESHELPDAANLLFQQVQTLGMPAWSAGYCIWDDDKKAVTLYMSSEGVLQPPFKAPVTEDELFIQMRVGDEQGKLLHVVDMGGEKLVKHYQYMRTLPVMGEVLDSIIKAGHPLPTFQIMHQAYFSKGFLLFITYEPVPKSHGIFIRFAKVFDQTYTRFLDLRRSEEQAREAQIEAAVEKVRSRSLAMQNPEELVEVAELLREEMGQLGVEELETSSIYIVDTQNLQAECWYAIKDIREDNRTLVSDEMTITLNDTLVGQEMCKFYTSNNEQASIVMRGDSRKEWINYCADRSQVLQGYYGNEIPERTYHLVKFKGGYMGAASPGDISAESWDLLKRAAAVFSFAYTRFKDLQDAAARARAAKIELALERVRSRSMAMHSSEELKEVIEIVYQQFSHLNVNIEHTGFIVDVKESDVMHIWLADQYVSPFEIRIPYFDSPHWNSFIEAKKTGTQFFTNYLSFEEKNSFYQDLFALIPALPEESRTAIFGKPGLAISTVLLSNAGLYIENLAGIPYTEEENGVLMRFAKVFEQTYTRFLDLQKAEAQARESRIEAALESVRSKAMAMRTSQDIAETTAASFEELKKLGIFSFRSGVGILTEGSMMAQVFADVRSTDGQLKALTTMRSMGEHPALQQQYEAWEQQKDYEQVLFGEELISYYDHQFFQTSRIDVHGGEQGKAEYGYYFSFPDGLFYSWSFQPYTESEKNILHRFRNIIALTFRRYLDLQKAEEQAREAIKQASLDRVRAVIASMRSAGDLEMITPLIFKELTILGVPFIRCGVFIIHEGKEIIEAYLSSPDGHALGVLNLPYKASELTFQTVEAWRNGQIFRQHWNKDDFMAWTKQMMEQHQIQDTRTYQGTEVPPESLELNFVPFTQGMLYVGAVDPLEENEIGLVQSLANAFSIAYARYEDFVKLEGAKTNIEAALAELKATQSQLVQQEKLASLGQLTAGIAHEIKNPLNFVNNFSELNLELIQEAMAEIHKGSASRDESLIDGILSDIQSNLQKVHEHGSRANGIVNSMLQHSRGGSGQMEPTKLNTFLREYVHFCFQGMRAGKHPIPVEVEWDLSTEVGEVPLIREDFSRVIVNISNNAFDAMRSKLQDEQKEDKDYVPLLVIRTKKEKNFIRVSFQDNGPGIPGDIKDKILQPFFTTKKGTDGTGLGLSITHDIVKAHGGELTVENIGDGGCMFILTLPFGV